MKLPRHKDYWGWLREPDPDARRRKQAMRFPAQMLLTGVGAGAGASARNLSPNAYYAFESLLADSTPNGTTLTNNGGVTQAAGKVGQAASFAAASSQYLSAASNSFLNFSTALTVMGWIKQASLGENSIACKGVFSVSWEWYAKITAAGGSVLNAFWPTAGNDTATSASGTFVFDTNWHHFAIVYNGLLTGNANRLKFIIDGTPDTLSFAGTIPASITNNGGDLGIGELPGIGQFMNGLLDELGFYPSALTLAQVQANYNSGAGVPY
jgi:hypothetical protein